MFFLKYHSLALDIILKINYNQWYQLLNEDFYNKYKIYIKYLKL